MSGDLPKQVKLKKPSRLKTLDTKPGVCPLGRNPSFSRTQAVGSEFSGNLLCFTRLEVGIDVQSQPKGVGL